MPKKSTSAGGKTSATTSKRKGTAAGKSTNAAKKSTGGSAKKSTTRRPLKKAAAAKKTAGKGTPGKTAKRVTRKTAAKPAAKEKVKKAPKKPSARKGGVLKKVAKALRKPGGKKKAVSPSALHKVLAAHGVEKKEPAVRPPFPAYRGTMPYIFVSYSHVDIKEVFRIIKQLNAGRYRIWFDEGIEPGNEWPEVVGRSVLECSQVIVFMSPTAVESRNVRNEINLATSADKNIIVIYLKSTSLSEGLLLQIGTVQYFNKFEMTDKEFIDKLKRVLNNDLHN